MREENARLPGFWRFVWLFWMQPVTLHRLLRSLEVDPKESGWKLLRRRRSPSENWWLVRSAQLLLLITLGAVLAGGLFAARGRPLDRNYVALGLAAGVAIGVACVVVDVATGLIFGAALVGAALVGVALVGLADGVTVGVVLGLALLGVAVASTLEVVIGVVFGEIPEAGGHIVVTIAAFLTSLSRIPVYLLEIIAQMAARYWNSMTGRSSLRWVPVLHHELSYLPHPFLESHLLAEADADPRLTRRVLDACSIAPGQRKTGRRVQAALRAKE